MAKLLHKTKGGSPSEGKPRVYFTCHPEDFEKHFENICEDIFATHDCVIYYTESMTEEIEEKYKESDLGQMNLFVIPITFKLLSKPNRAMDSDFRYAQEKHIPVLPIMMEKGLDGIYSVNDKFGEAQYLNPYAKDMTAISYEEKLKKYLESVLISSEMAERIRKAFDAYIFLSYRKKDRHYANELMKLIHSHPEFRDVAIWFDEFLTPGESFRANIEKMMKDSKLFALLVTPSLLEYVDGKPNYVMAHEYPDAKKAGMDILPTEMEETDKAELRSKYKDIPDCVNPNEDKQFKTRLLDSLSKIAISANNADPEHNFLIGLAYLDGIDVEKNAERGIELITMAAEANLLEAMEKLYRMYQDGIAIRVDYRKAMFWAERIVEYNREKYGAEDPITLTSLYNLAYVYFQFGEDPKKEIELKQIVYNARLRIFGEENADTLTALNGLSNSYYCQGEYKKSLESTEKVCALRCKILGENHPDTLLSFGNLALVYGRLGKIQKEADLEERIYKLQCENQGEKHPETLHTLSNLGTTYDELGDYQKALEAEEKAYTVRCEVLGEEHPDTLYTLSLLANIYSNFGNYQKAEILFKKAYSLQFTILGENHPDTLSTLNGLAFTYSNQGLEKALELFETVYSKRKRIMGEKHPETIMTKLNLANAYRKRFKFEKALELFEEFYPIQCEVVGLEDPDSLTTLYNLACTYRSLYNYSKALELFEKTYALRCKILGEEHLNTINTLADIANVYGRCMEYEKAYEIMEKVFLLSVRVFGVSHPFTIGIEADLKEYRRQIPFFKRIFKKK